MQQLIKKELILQKKLFIFGLLYSIFLFAVFANPVFRNFTYIMAAFGISYMLINGIAQVEHKNNSDIIMNSLPTTRKEIVGAKYLSIITGTIMALIIVSVIGFIFHQLPSPFNYRLINIFDVIITIISIWLLAAISLPLYIIIKAQWLFVVNMIIFLLIFFAPSQIGHYLAKNSHQSWVQAVIHTSHAQTWLLSLSGSAIMLVLLWISYRISLRIYVNKEF